MRKAVAVVAAGFVALVALLLLLVSGGVSQQQADAVTLAAVQASSCGSNDVTSGTSLNTPYSGPLPSPSGASTVSVVPLTSSLQQTYIAAAEQYPQVPWPILAGIGNVESGQGQNMGPSSAGAVGWMQFLPSTWDSPDPNNPGHTYGDGGDPADPAAAIPAAARLLISSGANGTPEGLKAAIFAYNHSSAYVDTVLYSAKVYASGGPTTAAAAPAAPSATPLACVPTDPGAPGNLSAKGCLSPVTHYTPTGRYGESRPGHIHLGLDLAAPYGTPVLSPCAGVVTYAGQASGYGGYICIQHTPTLTTCHGHEQAIYVTVGQHVPAGYHIGDVGGVGQGDATGPHDHFEVRTSLWGPTSDPAIWLLQNTLPSPKGATTVPSD